LNGESIIYSQEDLQEAVKKNCIIFLILGGVSFFTSYAQLSFFLYASQRQCNRIRKLYFRSLVSQEIGWYDKNDSGELLTHIAGFEAFLYPFL